MLNNQKNWNKGEIKRQNYHYFKNKYMIVFYDENDEYFVDQFDSLRELCVYKKIDINYENIKYLNRMLINALKRDDHATFMLDGSKMHVYLIDINDEFDDGVFA